mmetsp:Transcript_27525/g.53902  ORF Transcript_27525/g.53902 Transcript_27525/m.53902 type:complete len:225 (-) Transcript_27525:19-693(-)
MSWSNAANASSACMATPACCSTQADCSAFNSIGFSASGASAWTSHLANGADVTCGGASSGSRDHNLMAAALAGDGGRYSHVAEPCRRASPSQRSTEVPVPTNAPPCRPKTTAAVSATEFAFAPAPTRAVASRLPFCNCPRRASFAVTMHLARNDTPPAGSKSSRSSSAPINSACCVGGTARRFSNSARFEAASKEPLQRISLTAASMSYHSNPQHRRAKPTVLE